MSGGELPTWPCRFRSARTSKCRSHWSPAQVQDLKRELTPTSEGDLGLQLDDVLVGLLSRIRALLEDVAPGHQRLAP
jgi:hypothetical protein